MSALESALPDAWSTESQEICVNHIRSMPCRCIYVVQRHGRKNSYQLQVYFVVLFLAVLKYRTLILTQMFYSNLVQVFEIFIFTNLEADV